MTVGLTGQLRNGAAFEVGLGRSLTGTGSVVTSGNTLRLKYDHQVSADRFLVAEASVTHWNKVSPITGEKVDVQGRLDYRANFDW